MNFHFLYKRTKTHLISLKQHYTQDTRESFQLTASFRKDFESLN